MNQSLIKDNLCNINVSRTLASFYGSTFTSMIEMHLVIYLFCNSTLSLTIFRSSEWHARQGNFLFTDMIDDRATAPYENIPSYQLQRGQNRGYSLNGSCNISASLQPARLFVTVALACNAIILSYNSWAAFFLCFFGQERIGIWGNAFS